MSMWTLIAIAFAPLVAVFVQVLLLAIVGDEALRLGELMALLALFYAETWLFGLATHVVLSRRGRTNLLSYLIGFMVAGLAAGIAEHALLSLLEMSRQGAVVPQIIVSARSVIRSELLFALVGVAFWLIARPSRGTVSGA